MKLTIFLTYARNVRFFMPVGRWPFSSSAKNKK